MLRLFQKSFLRIMNKLRSLVVRKQDHGKMLTMHLEKTLFHQTQKPEVPAGYVVRNYQEKDYWQAGMLYIKSNIGFCDIEYFKPNILPDAHKLIVNENTGVVVASWFAAQSFHSNNVGRFEWLVVDKSHRGKGLGMAIAYEVTCALAQTDLGVLELNTFKKMKSALSIYAALGWQDESTV